MARRIASLGTPESLALLVEELGRAAGSGAATDAPGRDRRSACAAVARWRCRPPGPRFQQAGGRLRSSSALACRGTGAALSATRRRGRRCGECSSDPKADSALRREALAALLKVKDPSLAATLHTLVPTPSWAESPLRGLSAYDDPATPDVLIQAYASLGPAERRDALNTLAAPQNVGPRAAGSGRGG